MPEQTRPAGRPPRHLVLGFVLFALLLAGVAAFGIVQRRSDQAALRQRAEDAAVISVVVREVQAGPGEETLALPGNVVAYSEARILARTNGYLKRWLVDIGTRVRAGQLLAEIDTPEVGQQLRQAQADLATAEANQELARVSDARWQALLATNSVSRQEADEKAGDYAAKRQLAAGARANLARLQELVSFNRVVAPFEGTVTARNTDIGQLIASGSTELFRVADTRKLRIYVAVPQVYAASVKPGQAAVLRFPDRPGGQWPAKVVRSADALNAATRTLQVELQVDNDKGELFPGAYAEVRLKLPASAQVLRIPVNALLFRGEGLQVAKLGAGERVSLTAITPGRDFGTEIEVLAGLAAGDRIVINPPDSIQPEQQVRVATPAPAAAPQGEKP